MEPRRPPESPVPCRSVIFDLDDTLIDTFGKLVAPAHRNACQAMIDAGLNATLEALLARSAELLRNQPKADVYELLCDEHGATDPSIAEAGRLTYHQPKIPPGKELLLPGARALLRRLARDRELYLVTRGHEMTQAEKVRKNRLASSFTQIRYVGLTLDKHTALSSLVSQNGLEPAECVCVGDRIDHEIAAANALGMWTIRVAGGEFGALEPSTPDELAHWTVDDVRDVQPILREHFTVPE